MMDGRNSQMITAIFTSALGGHRVEALLSKNFAWFLVSDTCLWMLIQLVVTI